MMVSFDAPGDTSHQFATSIADDSCPWRTAVRAAAPGSTSAAVAGAVPRPSPLTGDDDAPSTTKHATAATTPLNTMTVPLPATSPDAAIAASRFHVASRILSKPSPRTA